MRSDSETSTNSDSKALKDFNPDEFSSPMVFIPQPPPPPPNTEMKDPPPSTKQHLTSPPSTPARGIDRFSSPPSSTDYKVRGYYSDRHIPSRTTSQLEDYVGRVSLGGTGIGGRDSLGSSTTGAFSSPVAGGGTSNRRESSVIGTTTDITGGGSTGGTSIGGIGGGGGRASTSTGSSSSTGVTGGAMVHDNQTLMNHLIRTELLGQSLLDYGSGSGGIGGGIGGGGGGAVDLSNTLSTTTTTTAVGGGGVTTTRGSTGTATGTGSVPSSSSSGAAAAAGSSSTSTIPMFFSPPRNKEPNLFKYSIGSPIRYSASKAGDTGTGGGGGRDSKGEGYYDNDDDDDDYDGRFSSLSGGGGGRRRGSSSIGGGGGGSTGGGSTSGSNSAMKKSLRKISKTPYKVLDAPSLQDDYYLNLVDWSSTNVLSVALGTAVYLWSANTSKVSKLCEFPTEDPVTSLAWAKSGNQIAVGLNSGSIQIWDSVTNQMIRKVKSHDARVGSLNWTSSLLASGSRDRVIYVHDMRMKAATTLGTMDPAPVAAATATPTSTTRPRGSTSSRNSASGHVNVNTNANAAMTTASPSVAVASTTTVATSSTPSATTIRTSSTSPFADIIATTATSAGVSVSGTVSSPPSTPPRTTTTAAGREREVAMANVYGSPISVAATAAASTAAVAGTGSASASRSANTTTSTITTNVSGISSGTRAVHHSPLLMGATTTSVESVLLSELRAHQQEVCGLKWSFDEKMLASGGNDNKLYVWDVRQHGRHTSPLCKFEDHTAAVKAVAWSPHQHGLLASGGGTADRHIRFWNATTNMPLHKIDTGSQVCNLMWSKSVNEIVSTHGYSLNQVIVWKYPTMQKVITLSGHTCRVLYLAMSPDGQTIVTGAGDETLRFWNVFPPPKNKNGTPLGHTMLLPSPSDGR